MLGGYFFHSVGRVGEVIHARYPQSVKRPLMIQVTCQSGIDNQFCLAAKTAGDEEKGRFAAAWAKRHQCRVRTAWPVGRCGTQALNFSRLISHRGCREKHL